MRKLNKYVFINADLKEKFHYKLYPTFLTLSLSCNCFLPLVIKNKFQNYPPKETPGKHNLNIQVGSINVVFHLIVPKPFHIGINMNLRNRNNGEQPR